MVRTEARRDVEHSCGTGVLGMSGLFGFEEVWRALEFRNGLVFVASRSFGLSELMLLIAVFILLCVLEIFRVESEGVSSQVLILHVLHACFNQNKQN